MQKPSKDFDSAQVWKASLLHSETAHAILPAIRLARELPSDDAVIVNLSGRGDKDVQLVAELQRQ